MSITDNQTVWREDQRIRRTDGTGYADFVSDEEIHTHIAADDGTDPLCVPFAEAVLAVRRFERAAARRAATYAALRDVDQPVSS